MQYLLIRLFTPTRERPDGRSLFSFYTGEEVVKKKSVSIGGDMNQYGFVVYKNRVTFVDVYQIIVRP